MISFWGDGGGGGEDFMDLGLKEKTKNLIMLSNGIRPGPSSDRAEDIPELNPKIKWVLNLSPNPI